MFLSLGYCCSTIPIYGRAEISRFEPNSKNYLCTCDSMRLSGQFLYNKIDGGCSLHPGEASLLEEFNSKIHKKYGVSNGEGQLHFQTDKNNAGASMVTHNKMPVTTLQVVSLDGIIKEFGWYDSDTSILKVDVEGQLLVIYGSKQMLWAKRAKALFMEGSGRSKPEVEWMTKLFNIGYHGPTSKVSVADHSLA
jgi:hypothetical protein